jgi:hypothetical protein
MACPRTAREVSLGLELRKLCRIIRVSSAAWPKPISNGERDVILSTYVEDVVPVLIRKVFSVVEEAELGVDGAATGDNASDAISSERNEAEQDACVDGEVVDPLQSPD